ncbi:hypothetical protein NZL82_05910 [Sphingomonas sanguinis]|uniref:hypothetical protein n=1 Tax=Sphingomonas sp. LC-1 TaxID=3110957 RepID=UPI0021BAB353|nr:hypothetical protein [Sphingomonas sp. LC-1]MCT8001412.1 hypothetical protein [Sphingomonas sp. LC-1]
MSTPRLASAMLPGSLRWLTMASAPWLIASSATRYDWSTADLSYLDGSPYRAEAAPSQALCRKLIDREPAASERPSAAQATALKDCDSEALLYGIGRPADPMAARQCAMLERDSGSDKPNPYFTGPGILAVAYANGWGGPRDIERAIHMACGIDDAPAATQDRIANLSRLSNASGAKPFDICADASSGASGGLCASHDARLQDQSRARTIAIWQRSWTASRRTAFDRAYANMADYARTAHDLDCFRGTAAAECTIRGTQKDLDRFLAKVGALLGRNPPPPVPPIEARTNAATAADRWAKQVAELDKDDRPDFQENGRKTVAARARFERDLLAFAATIPGTTPHRTRQLFSDL